MEILSKVGEWANKLTDIGMSVIALGVVLEVLFSGVGIPQEIRKANINIKGFQEVFKCSLGVIYLKNSGAIFVWP